MNRPYTEALMEYAGSGSVKARYTYGNERLYTTNAAAEGLVGRIVSAAYFYDGHGSVGSLLSMADGETLSSYAYGPFGVLGQFRGLYYSRGSGVGLNCSQGLQS